MDVLVVEDDGAVRENLAEFLSESGLRTEQAESAEDGLVLMEELGPPKILVTDLDLGAGMGGFSLAEMIARRWRTVPVIFISGRPWLLQSHILGLRERFLAKPFSHRSLLQVIKELRELSLCLGVCAVLTATALLFARDAVSVQGRTHTRREPVPCTGRPLGDEGRGDADVVRQSSLDLTQETQRPRDAGVTRQRRAA